MYLLSMSISHTTVVCSCAIFFPFHAILIFNGVQRLSHDKDFQNLFSLIVTCIYRSVRPMGSVDSEVEITAKRVGECVVIVSFECNEMGDIQGETSVAVKP